MERNRLQIELEKARKATPERLIDLADTNFHRNGMLFPDAILRPLIDDYLRVRSYQPEAKGAIEARQAISDYYRARSVTVPPERLLITASTSESYSLLFSALAEAGDNVLLPLPTYPLFEYLVDFARLEARYYQMSFDRNFVIDVETLRAQIDGRTRFVVLISPNNPTGRVAEAAEIDALLELCEERGCMLIVDEVFSEFLYEGAPTDRSGFLPRPAARETPVPVFTLNGISKMFASPDLKLAWIALTGGSDRRGDLLERLELANDTFLSCSSLSQHLLPGLFREGAAFVSAMHDRVAENRALLLSRLTRASDPATGGRDRPRRGPAGLELVVPTGGIHAVIAVRRSPEWRDDEEFAVELLRTQQLYLHPGYFYGLDESEERLYLVVSFLSQRARLDEGLERLVAFVSGGSARAD